MQYPVGTIIASDTEVWIKKESFFESRNSPFYETWWMQAQSYACPVYGDEWVSSLLEDTKYKIIRYGKD